MESHILNDKLVQPNDEIVFSIIGHTELLWKQTFSYLYDNNKNISVVWEYSNCGKYWGCVARKQKKTLFRIHLLKKNSFSIAFPIGDKFESLILQSKLSQDIKDYYLNAPRYSTTKYIAIDVEDSVDLENIKILINLKTNN